MRSIAPPLAGKLAALCAPARPVAHRVARDAPLARSAARSDCAQAAGRLLCGQRSALQLMASRAKHT